MNRTKKRTVISLDEEVESFFKRVNNTSSDLVGNQNTNISSNDKDKLFLEGMKQYEKLLSLYSQITESEKKEKISKEVNYKKNEKEEEYYRKGSKYGENKKSKKNYDYYNDDKIYNNKNDFNENIQEKKLQNNKNTKGIDDGKKNFYDKYDKNNKYDKTDYNYDKYDDKYENKSKRDNNNYNKNNNDNKDENKLKNTFKNKNSNTNDYKNDYKNDYSKKYNTEAQDNYKDKNKDNTIYQEKYKDSYNNKNSYESKYKDSYENKYKNKYKDQYEDKYKDKYKDPYDDKYKDKYKYEDPYKNKYKDKDKEKYNDSYEDRNKDKYKDSYDDKYKDKDKYNDTYEDKYKTKKEDKYDNNYKEKKYYEYSDKNKNLNEYNNKYNSKKYDEYDEKYKSKKEDSYNNKYNSKKFDEYDEKYKSKKENKKYEIRKYDEYNEKYSTKKYDEYDNKYKTKKEDDVDNRYSTKKYDKYNDKYILRKYDEYDNNNKYETKKADEYDNNYKENYKYEENKYNDNRYDNNRNDYSKKTEPKRNILSKNKNKLQDEYLFNENPNKNSWIKKNINSEYNPVQKDKNILSERNKEKKKYIYNEEDNRENNPRKKLSQSLNKNNEIKFNYEDKFKQKQSNKNNDYLNEYDNKNKISYGNYNSNQIKKKNEGKDNLDKENKPGFKKTLKKTESVPAKKMIKKGKKKIIKKGKNTKNNNTNNVIDNNKNINNNFNENEDNDWQMNSEQKLKIKILKKNLTDNTFTKKFNKTNDNKEKEKPGNFYIYNKNDNDDIYYNDNKKPKNNNYDDNDEKYSNEDSYKNKNNKNENEDEDYNENEEEKNSIENDELEKDYTRSPIEKAEYQLEPNFLITAQWYYLTKKNTEDENENEKDEDPEKEEKVHIDIKTKKTGKIIFHWGIYKAMSGLTWYCPPASSYPPNTKVIDKLSVETEFPAPKKGERVISITLSRGEGYKNYIGGINFVVFDPVKNFWYNNYRKDYQIKFKLKVNKLISRQFLAKSGLYVPEFMFDVINCEANYGSWTLMHRYNKCSEIISPWNLEIENDNWIWIYIWIRYSFLRQLDWQRNYNTRPALLGGAMANLSNLLTNKYSDSYQNEKQYKKLIDSKSTIIKNILALLGKGTGNGQEIRDEILKVMHRNKIPKCPAGNFYEQWHQKLHNNTTPEDIIICEAVINFLKSKGDKKVYWDTLHKGGVTKERLKSYERNIVDEPWYNSAYNVKDFENYLKILKSVHASTDLMMTYESCKNFIGNCCGKMDEILKNKDNNDIINQIKRVAECRENLQNVIKNILKDSGKLREVLFLELSLEIYVRQLVEKVIHIQKNFNEYIDEISLVLRNIKISYPNFKEFLLCYEDWKNIVEKLVNDNSKISFLKIKSVTSRINRLLSSVVDYYNNYYDAKAKFFGKECNCDNYVVEIFVEEIIRGTIFFALSMLMKKIEPFIRKNAKLGDWLYISRGNKKNKIYGKLVQVPKLEQEQFSKYAESKIIICSNISGDEEIPLGCVCLIIIKSENYPDILAHVSVRARNLGVPFLVCFNEEKANNILKLVNKSVNVSLMNNDVLILENKGGNDLINNINEMDEEFCNKITLVDSGDEYKNIYLELDEFDENSVGQKSKNTQKVFGNVPNCNWLKYPESFSIPFNVMEYFLSLEENQELLEELNEYIEKINMTTKKENIISLLEKCKQTVLKIKYINNDETTKLKKRLIKFGIKENQLQDAFTAIKSVWASKFNERVYLAISKVGIELNQIKMSVLCQKIIPAEYAFVIHTKNPTNNNENEIFAEIVNGMGESLVGAYEGQSFSFSYNKKNNNYEILSFQNKNVSLQNSGFIFRSDSNMEDLEGFSGAGLFDSVPMVKDKEVEMVYNNDKLFNDKNFCDEIIRKIAKLGIEVEKMYGIPQDIEGVYYNKDLYIVQTRPQV